MEDKNKRIKYLEDKIIMAKKAYYSLNETESDLEMLDSEFDLLEDELRSLDPNNSVLSQVGVEESNVKFEKVSHKTPMLSIEKVNSKEGLFEWYERKLFNDIIIKSNLIIEPKIDGVSGDLYYKDGKFVLASTRGNGKIGYEIKSEFFNCIPKNTKINIKDFHVRGEFYLPKIYNDMIGNSEPIALRNICAGALKKKEYDNIHKEIKFVAYQLISDNNFEKESDIIDLLKTEFETVEYSVMNTIKEVYEFFELYIASLRDKWAYETDGLVIRFNNIETQKIIEKELGSTDHHNKYTVAIKPTPNGAWSELIEVEWNTSKSGDVIPTAIYKPVRIGSAIFNRASLYNMSFIKAFDIRLYNQIYVVRTNDIIPKIISTKQTKYSDEIKLDSCPSCGSKLTVRGVHYHCNNYSNCPAQIINKFLHWFTMNEIKNIGPSSLDSLINAGHFYNLWELYAMDSETLLKVIEKFVGISKDTQSMKDFITSFENTKNQTEQEVIGNYGIPSIGLKTLEKYNVENLNDLIKYKNVNYMNSDVAFEKNLCIWLNEEGNFDNLFSLIKFLKPIKVKNKDITNKKKFCITGAFTNKKRNTVEKEIESTGLWEFVPSVTRETDLLIVGNESSIKNKELTAIRLKIPIIRMGATFDLKEFEKLV